MARGYKAPSGRRIRPGDVGLLPETVLSEIMLIEGIDDSGVNPITLETYQGAYLSSARRFRCIEKSRQMGFSWIFAGEGVARATLRENYTGVFISYNHDDAKEKIRYARQIAENVPAEFRKRIVEDSKTHLAFEGKHGVSRLVSLPCRAPRGKGGDIWLDEFAHYIDDTKIYAGSTALIARVPDAQLTICSTPAGRRGTFWAIACQETDQRYPSYSRQRVPWWLSRHYCKDPAAALADGVAQMPTEERVRKWGLPAIVEQFDTLLVEDFMQEFECAYIDEAHSFYPWSLINPCAKDITLHDDFDGWEVKGRLTAGYDVGRKRDVSALVIVEEIDGHSFVRYVNAWGRKPFEEQESLLVALMESLPIQRFRIDQNGIGMHLAEIMVNRFGVERVDAATFNAQNKELWATDLKILMDKRNITLPRQRDLLVQMHSIRKTTSAHGNHTFDSEKNARHHGDLYWALALAAHRERRVVKPMPKVRVNVRVIG